VLYDDGGAVMSEIGTFLGVATNNVAEWTGLITGLEAALEVGVTEIAVRLDSELVVKQLSGAYRVKHENLIPLHARAKALLRKFAAADVRHVPRKENKAADAVVNQVLDANRSLG
jgi:ribonuclease HI